MAITGEVAEAVKKDYRKEPRRDFASPEERFWSKVHKTDGCWLWTAAQTKGYGQANYRGRHGYAHRFAWEMTHGPISSDVMVCHSCDTPLCCRPDHLFLGDAKINLRDAISKGRFQPGKTIGEDSPHAKLDAEKVKEIRRLRNAGEPYKKVAEMFGISRALVYAVAKGSAWKHVTDRP